MVTIFVVVQVGVNLVLISALFFLLRERQATARLAMAREARLEALAAEFCTLGQQIVTESTAQTTPAAELQKDEAARPIQEQSGNPAIGQSGNPAIRQSGDPATRQSGNQANGPSGVPRIAEPGDRGTWTAQQPDCQIARLPDCQNAQEPEAPDRLKAAAALLDRGLSVAAVASRTAIPDGEIQVLKNLRRARTSAHCSTPPRKRQAAVPG